MLRYLPKGNEGCGAFSGSPKNEASASLSSSLKTMNLGFCSVQGAHAPPCGPLGSPYFTKLLHAVSIFSERSQSPFVQGRQQFFFGEMAFNYFADQNKEFVVRRRSTRYDECFRKLPDEFKTQQFMDCFGCSQSAASRAIERFRKDGIVADVKYGLYKKVVSELP